MSGRFCHVGVTPSAADDRSQSGSIFSLIQPDIGRRIQQRCLMMPS